MQILLLLCFVVFGCLATPYEKSTINRKMATKLLIRAVADTPYAVSKRKRDTTNCEGKTIAIEMAFCWVDSNHDDHITADEFASFYSTFMTSIPLTENQWKMAFRMALPRVDMNRNGLMELNEFEKMSQMGLNGKK